MKHIALICNPTHENAKALQVADAIVAILKGKGVSYTIFTAYWPEVLDGFTDVWIVGGDGTLNHFINQHPDTQLPLSVFAGGSGNDFHWMLYGETGVLSQVEQVLQGKPRLIDAGVCNGQLFLNGVGIGFDGTIVKDLWGKKKLAGKASYLLSILKNIVQYKESYCEISLDERFVAQECFMISVANSKRYGGGFLVAPKANVQDGLLDVNIVGTIAPLKRMRFLPVIERGEHTELGFVQYHQSAKVVIQCRKSLDTHIDGEYIKANRFEIQVLPNKFLFSV